MGSFLFFIRELKNGYQVTEENWALSTSKMTFSKLYSDGKITRLQDFLQLKKKNMGPFDVLIITSFAYCSKQLFGFS